MKKITKSTGKKSNNRTGKSTVVPKPVEKLPTYSEFLEHEFSIRGEGATLQDVLTDYEEAMWQLAELIDEYGEDRPVSDFDHGGYVNGRLQFVALSDAI